jgi:transcriptional regulator with XRE-family HTH domain
MWKQAKPLARTSSENANASGCPKRGLGHLCDLNMTEISRLEGAKRDPRLTTIVKVAKGLGIPPSRLLDGIP